MQNNEMNGNLEFPKEWAVFGPAGKDNPEPDFSALTEVPAALVVGGKRLAARQAVFADNRLDLGALLGGMAEGKTAYLLANVEAAQEGDVELGAGADWWMKWWVNGEAVFDTLATGNDARPPTVLDHRFAARLRAGRNLIAVKVVSGSGSFVLAAGGPRELHRMREMEEAERKQLRVTIANQRRAVRTVIETELARRRASGRDPAPSVVPCATGDAQRHEDPASPHARRSGAMTPRERFLASCGFKPVDRIPYRELVIYGQAIDRWLKEGLPTDKYNVCDLMGGNAYFGTDRWEHFSLDVGLLPAFDPVVLEETDETVLFIDGQGVKRLTSRHGVSHGHTPNMDQYIEFPVKCRNDFERLKLRLDPSSAERYPGTWRELTRQYAARDYPVGIMGGFGLFSGLRRLMGTENACTLFYDDPALAHEMLDFLTAFAIATYRPALQEVRLDYVEIWEDFAFKDRPFVGPGIFNEFLAPHYRRFTEFVRSHGVEFVSLDSDGNFEVLIPQLIDVGVNIIWPVEVAAGMDAPALRKKYGHDLILWGGIDKREIAKGPAAIEQEVLRQVPQLIEDGGYVPHLDGSWPGSIPYDCFLYFMELKAVVAEGRYGS